MNKTGVYYMSGWAVDPNLVDQYGVPRPTGWHFLQEWNAGHAGTTNEQNFREAHWLTNFYDGAPHTSYDNSRQEVVDNNILGMYDAKFQFVTFQTGWWRTFGTYSPDSSGPFWIHAISKYQSSQYKNLLQWALLWDEEDNSTNYNTDSRWGGRWNAGWRGQEYRADFAKMVAYWRDNFLQDPQYLRIDGKPIIFILADLSRPHDRVFYQDPNASTDATALIALLRQTVSAAGLPVYLVGFAGDPNNLSRVDSLKTWGFDAITGYQYRTTPNDYANGWSMKDAFYRNTWPVMANKAIAKGLTYFPPTTTGFDNRDLPADPANNFIPVYEGISSAEQYRVHLIAAKNFVAANPGVTRGYAMNCCWNEWTEGSYLDRASDVSTYKGTDHADSHMRVYSANPTNNRAPIGWIDGTDGHYTLYGWALDEDAPSQGVSLDVYIDGCGISSHYATGGGTIYYHPYVNTTYNTVGNHGFRVPIPEQYRDGRQHTVCIYAFDTEGALASLIGQGNYTFVAYP